MNILTGPEARALTVALLDGTGGYCTEDEIDEFLRHAEGVRVEARLMRLALEGRAVVRRGPNGDWQWKRSDNPDPVFMP